MTEDKLVIALGHALTTLDPVSVYGQDLDDPEGPWVSFDGSIDLRTLARLVLQKLEALA